MHTRGGSGIFEPFNNPFSLAKNLKKAMNQSVTNKEFILEYLAALSGIPKPTELLEMYTSDQVLIEHIRYFDTVFPNYTVIADELIAEGNRVVIRARLIGKHTGVFGDIPPTFREVDFPIVVSYTIENRKIISHWLVADQMVLMEQLGVSEAMAG